MAGIESTELSRQSEIRIDLDWAEASRKNKLYTARSTTCFIACSQGGLMDLKVRFTWFNCLKDLVN